MSDRFFLSLKDEYMEYIININNLVGLVYGVKRHFQEKTEDTKGVIIIRMSTKNRQHSGQKIPKG